MAGEAVGLVLLCLIAIALLVEAACSATNAIERTIARRRAKGEPEGESR